MEAFKAKKINQFDYQNRLLFISNKTRVFYNYLIKLVLNKKKFHKVSLPNNIKGNFKKDDLFFIIKESFDDDFIKIEKQLNTSELRSSKKLEWLKYKYNKYIKKKDLIIIKIFKNNEFVGYFLIVKAIEKNYNFKKLTIAEIIVLNDDEEILNETIKFCKNLTKKYNSVALVKIASQVLGGKGGGGRKDFAQAGGIDQSKIEEAFKAILQEIN